MFKKEDLYEKTIKEEIIFEGHVFSVKKLTVTQHNGREATREIVEHNGGVCVIAINENNEVILVEQFRKPLDKVIYEIPAGKLEKNEDPLDAINRELREETGYTSKNIEYLGRISPTPGYSSEYIYIYKATELVKGETDFDDGEFINTIYMNVDTVKEKIKNGEIFDGKTVAAFAYI